MKGNKVEYEVQPAFNTSFTHVPPSYSDAVRSSSFMAANPYPTFTMSAYPQPFVAYSSEVSAPVAPPQQGNCVRPPVLTYAVGPGPSKILCPFCHVQVVTVTRSACQKSAHIACFVLCILGCCLCSCIPYCMRSFKDIHHSCPECNSFIGTYKS